MKRLSVVRAGFLTTVQDFGRRGARESGVAVGGALDEHALRVANLLAGNDESAAGLEVTFSGLQLRFADARILAWCGGQFDVRIGSAPVPIGHAVHVCADEELMVDRPRIGCRCWLAISGGIDVPVVLGSRATDLRANFGGLEGRALRDGDDLPLGDALPRAAAAPGRRISSWSAPVDWTATAVGEPILRIVRGADWNRFSAAAQVGLTSERYSVSPDSNRMGIRLEGRQLERNDAADLVSEGVAPGTIQVPPSGQPIVLLGDCQTIGGYPKIAHVITVDLPIAAQLRAGDSVRFREVSMAEAHRLLAKRERDFQWFETALSLRAS